MCFPRPSRGNSGRMGAPRRNSSGVSLPPGRVRPSPALPRPLWRPRSRAPRRRHGRTPARADRFVRRFPGRPCFRADRHQRCIFHARLNTQAAMDSALVVDRLQFAFTITYHYLFPQLTMGLALLILVLKTLALRTGNERYSDSARFWARIFGINFVFGVVTGIPMEFQFGTNWAAFSRYAGGVIGQTLAMEGMFAFFLESAFLGLFLFGERRLGPRGHW